MSQGGRRLAFSPSSWVVFVFTSGTRNISACLLSCGSVLPDDVRHQVPGALRDLDNAVCELLELVGTARMTMFPTNLCFFLGVFFVLLWFAPKVPNTITNVVYFFGCSLMSVRTCICNTLMFFFLSGGGLPYLPPSHSFGKNENSELLLEQVHFL